MTINNDEEYQQALAQYEIVKCAETGVHHDAKMALVKAISVYENYLWDLPEPIGNKFDENKF